MLAAGSLEIEIPRKIAWLASKPKRVKIAVGGRGSGKSTGVGDLMLLKALQGERICCTREFQNSIDDSVHENLKLEIDRLGLDNHFAVQSTEIKSAKGGHIFYRGLARNITSLKSLAGVRALWIEEGESCSDRSLKVLTPSIRSSARDNVTDLHEPPEIWITMNRGSSRDAVAQKYLSRAEQSLAKTGYYEDDLMMVVEINWQENPWFPPELDQERRDDYKNLPRAEYDHIWEGKYGDQIPNALIAPEVFDACVNSHLVLGFEASGQERFAYDPADVGDAKAIAYCHGPVVLDVRSTEDGRVDTATDWALSLAIEKRPDVFVWDADGMGMGLKRQLSQSLEGKKILLEPFRGSEGPDQPGAVYERLERDVAKAKTNRETFSNKRAQYYFMLRDRMYRTFLAVERGERVFNPDDLLSFSGDIPELQALRSELCRIPRKYSNSGKLQLMSKPDMLRQDIPSPNMADAVMMLQRTVEVKRQVKKIKSVGWGGR